MKKLFLIIILTMVLFVGCSSNDTTQQEDKNKLLLENLRKEADLLLNKYEESENFIKKLNADISNLKYQQQEIQNEKDALKSKDNILSEKREILKSNNRILKEIIFNSDKDGIDYNQLTDEEKKQYQLIKNTIAKKIPYNIDLDYFEPEYGKIIFDFNNDNKVETLYYVTNKGKDQYNYTILDKCMIYINGMTIENEYHNNYEIRAGISHIGIIDVDLNDNYIEFYITQGNLSDRVLNSIYRLTEGGVELVGKFEGEILAFSGDGKIYYWGGNLFEPNEFNTDLVLSYFDFNEKKIISTNQIIGKQFKAPFDIVVYDNVEDVIMSIMGSDEKGIKLVKMNEEFEVIGHSKDDAQIVQIKTEDGTIGWIGGFHVVLD